MPPAQLQHLLLDRRRRLVGMPRRRPAAVLQSGFAFPAIALQPLITAFARDLITTAQLRHRPLPALIVVAKNTALVHHTAHLPGHASLLHAPAVRTKLSTISPVCSVNHVPVCTPNLPWAKIN